MDKNTEETETKPNKRRTQVRDMPKPEKELTPEEKKVNGGASDATKKKIFLD